MPGPIHILLDAIIKVLYWLILAHIIFSWIRGVNPTLERIAQVVDDLVNPLLDPLRKVVPSIDIGGAQIDITALVALILLGIVGPMILAFIP